MPGIEIDHFGLPELTPADWTTQLAATYPPRRPRLVLVCVSADDVVAGPESADWLDSRSLAVGRRNLRRHPARADNRLRADVDFESFVRRRAPAVAACRTDDDPTYARRWHHSQLALSRLVHQCRLHDIGVGLVLTPGEYQLAPNLAASYCRNLGLEAGRIDVDLPQRRWTAYADKLEVASVDLLPAFRGAGARVLRTGERPLDRARTIGRGGDDRSLAGRGVRGNDGGGKTKRVGGLSVTFRRRATARQTRRACRRLLSQSTSLPGRGSSRRRTGRGCSWSVRSWHWFSGISEIGRACSSSMSSRLSERRLDCRPRGA